MGHCGKCWFGVMRPCSLFLSLLMLCDTVAPDVQMRIYGKCWFEGNETIFFISESPDAFVTLLHLIFKWDFVGNVDLKAMRHALYSWVSWVFCDFVAPDVQMRLFGNFDLKALSIFLNFWVSWCFCDTVAPDVQMRLCWKCWCEGNEYLFLIPESPDAFVTLLHLMFKWDFVGNVDLKAMSICS